jgi:ribosomal protein L15
VSLERIAKVYPTGGEVNPVELFKLKVIKKRKGRIPEVKILNSAAKFDVIIVVSGCTLSLSAKEKITKAGGSIIDDTVVEKSVEKPKTPKIKEVK